MGVISFVYVLILSACVSSSFAQATNCDGNQASCSGSPDAALRPSSLLQRQSIEGKSSMLSAVEDTAEGCGHQHIIRMSHSQVELNSLVLQPASEGLGFIHIPQNAGEGIETLGLKSGMKWGFNAINHTYFEKVELAPNEVCTWHVVPPRYLPGVTVYSDKPLFCVTREPTERLFSTYLAAIKQLDRNCPISKRDSEILTHYEKCTPESLNYFATEALKGGLFDFDCNLVPQSLYVWALDGQQVCTEVIKFKDLPTALPALFSKYNIAVPGPGPSPSLLQSFGDSTRNHGSNMCPGLTVADFNANSTLAILDHFHDDFVKLGYN